MAKSGNGGGSTAPAAPPIPLMNHPAAGASGGITSSALPAIPGAANMQGPGSAQGAPPILPPLPATGFTPPFNPDISTPAANSALAGAPSTAISGLPTGPLSQPQTPHTWAPPPIAAAGNSPADQMMAANQAAAQGQVANRLNSTSPGSGTAQSIIQQMGLSKLADYFM